MLTAASATTAATSTISAPVSASASAIIAETRAVALLALLLIFWTLHRFGKAVKNLTATDPNLDPDTAISRMSSRSRIINIRSQSMERNTTVFVLFRARYFRATQTTAALDLDPFGAHLHRRPDRLLHGAAETDAAFQLARN